jgi:hypothetical protein
MDERTKNVLTHMENLILLVNTMTKTLEGLGGGTGPISPDLAETAHRLHEGLRSLQVQLHLLSTNQ